MRAAPPDEFVRFLPYCRPRLSDRLQFDDRWIFERKLDGWDTAMLRELGEVFAQ